MRKIEVAINRVVIATGISSVVTQLLTIREFLTQFNGNEFIIALILFNWLVLGGVGTLLAHTVSKNLWPASVNRLGGLSFCLACLPVLQILGIRILREIFFIYGSSVGFYPAFAFTFFTIAPYCLLIGFVLPYSFFTIRKESPDYPGAKIYITDNLGDITGGALFSFILVFLVSPMQAVLLANLPLILATYLLFHSKRRFHPGDGLFAILSIFILSAGIYLETPSLAPSVGKLAFYRESHYGRITVHQDKEQFTLFEDGIPSFSSQNLTLAEEAIHYPLSQIDYPKNILILSAEAGMMTQIKKYQPESVDFVELNPDVSNLLFRFNMIRKIPGLNVINQDGRAYLSRSKKIYDAIIINLPEPETFQINRFFTDRFYKIVKEHLSPKGILSFSVKGFDNYLAESQLKKLSSLYNTAAANFDHILMLPGQKIYFLCSNHPVFTDIPARLAAKNISTRYIRGYYYGNVTLERIQQLNELIDKNTPKNFDHSPHLILLVFFQWFAKYSTSPNTFIAVLSLITLIYLIRISREEFVLFSTGCFNMGSEILVIFAFQIFFGYIYLQIGLIITVFLAGLLPGAWLANRLKKIEKKHLIISDFILIILMAVFIFALKFLAYDLPVVFFLLFGFMVSLACGFQFPVALYLKGGDNSAASHSFSADLIGAASGTLLTSVVLLPFLGIYRTAAALIALKGISLIWLGTGHEKSKQA
jgi:spermidine synthase